MHPASRGSRSAHAESGCSVAATACAVWGGVLPLSSDANPSPTLNAALFPEAATHFPAAAAHFPAAAAHIPTAAAHLATAHLTTGVSAGAGAAVDLFGNRPHALSADQMLLEPHHHQPSFCSSIYEQSVYEQHQYVMSDCGLPLHTTSVAPSGHSGHSAHSGQVSGQVSGQRSAPLRRPHSIPDRIPGSVADAGIAGTAGTRSFMTAQGHARVPAAGAAAPCLPPASSRYARLHVRARRNSLNSARPAGPQDRAGPQNWHYPSNNSARPASDASPVHAVATSAASAPPIQQRSSLDLLPANSATLLLSMPAHMIANSIANSEAPRMPAFAADNSAPGAAPACSSRPVQQHAHAASTGNTAFAAQQQRMSQQPDSRGQRMSQRPDSRGQRLSQQPDSRGATGGPSAAGQNPDPGGDLAQRGAWAVPSCFRSFRGSQECVRAECHAHVSAPCTPQHVPRQLSTHATSAGPCAFDSVSQRLCSHQVRCVAVVNDDRHTLVRSQHP